MKLKVSVFLLGFIVLGNAQDTFEIGKIIDSIKISESTKETFALYLPQSFNHTQPSSVVYIFDPAARGKVGIKPFIKASERYNYILVCSNNTRNGPYERNFDITDRLFDFTFSNFQIRENQVFLAGFSGGSRLASTIAVLTNKIAGVVACGAGFSSNPNHVPSTQKFSYAAICGNEDMNYVEMIKTKRYLQNFNFTQTLITYNGNHSWPHEEEILKAFDWLEIQAYKKGKKTKTDEQIYKSYQSNYAVAVEAEKNERRLQTIENYQRLLDTYQSFYDLDSIKTKLKNLKKDKLYIKTINSLSKVLEEEIKQTDKFNLRFSEDYKNPKKVNFSWWERELGKLRKLENSKDSEIQKMGMRMRYKIFARAYEKSSPNLNQVNRLEKQFCDTIRKMVYPEFDKKWLR
ncbi:hypothetical protein [Aquimarina algiphila]|uniref:hypothetical protein n=1 Tax=Aquimarina algiphila TaxID=2047982 RepID=UPI00248FB90C|nr:hypothetical protein [Aquimarina algiphila]